MARPLKESLDYFPLDIDFDQDDKLVVPLAKFGMEGLGIIVKLMGEVYRNGYFYPWTEREHYVFSNRVNVDINLVKDIVNECIKWGFFNQKVFEAHNVLTSKGFQKRYIEAAKRRKAITINESYLLIDPAEECKNVSHSIKIVNADGNQVNVYINPDKCNNQSAQTPQSKVKESKVKESKEDKELIEPVVVPNECDLSFQKFWETYPTKGSNKKMSLQKWMTLWKKKKIVLEEVLDGVNRYVQYQNHNGYSICAAQVFLNQERWKDEWVIEEGQRGGYQGSQPFAGGSAAISQYNQNNKPSTNNGQTISLPRNATGDGTGLQKGGANPAPSKYDQFVRR